MYSFIKQQTFVIFFWLIFGAPGDNSSMQVWQKTGKLETDELGC